MYGEGAIVREVRNSFSSRLICKILSPAADSLYWMNTVHFPQSSYPLKELIKVLQNSIQHHIVVGLLYRQF